jgi:large conductance mechanosensitive channel
MPPLGKILGNVDFSQLYINLSEQTFASLAEAEAASAPVIRYGIFINNIINFLVVALTIFVVLKIFFRSKFKDGKIS